MRRTRTFNAGLLLALVLAVAGGWLWIGHARARDLGRASDVLGYDAAQYAVAARELAEHGRLATPFALPVELARHSHPPWPLALVQPGLLVAEAALFRLSGHASPERLGWLVLVIPFICYLGAAMALGLGALAFLCEHAESVPAWQRWLGAFVVGAALLLDPEAQHYATGGFTELPFTLGLAAAVAWLAAADRAPAFRFGLLLGATGLFRGAVLWLAPVLGVALASTRPSRRAGAFLRVMAGCAVVLSPWWIYKWSAFGTPAWDLSALSLWDGVGGRTWFTLNHLPSMPSVPHGLAAARALMLKLVRNLPVLALALATGPRTLWFGALALCLIPGPLSKRASGRATAFAVLAMLVVSAVVAAVTEPLLRYLLPVRLVGEAAGLIAIWAYLWGLPEEWATPRARTILCGALAALALGWGARQTARGLAEASTAAHDRGVPSAPVLREIARDLNRELPPGEAVMSNLGPSLAWYARRPVVHLALTPADVDACRQRLDVREVIVAFREASRAWTGWDELVARPTDALRRPEWNVLRVRQWSVKEGFSVVWLELGPLRPPMAAAR